LHATLTWHTASRDKHESFVQCCLARAGIENDFRDVNDILRQSAMTDRILGYKFEQRRIMKIVPAFKNDRAEGELRYCGLLRKQ